MSSKQYTTEFVIKGDSTSGVKATRELQQANADMTREMQRAQRQSEEMTASFESVSAHAQRLATVSAATTAAMGAMAVAQTHNVAEQAALARSVGVTVQTLQRWEFAAQSVNLGAGKMGDIFKDTSEKIGDFVATGGGEAADLFERLNLDIDTLMGMRPDQQLIAIGEALDGVATQGEKIFFMESLANDASRLLPLLENNAAALRDQISLADQLGVALPQSDIDSIEQAAQKLNELTALGTAFANSVAAEWAPSFIAVSDGAQELTQWLGGMGEVVELVNDGAGLLSGVLAGRLVGSLVASGAATVKKINADRAAAAQSAVVAQRERQVALETARRAEAEQVAAQNSARVAAQRAQAAELEAASKLREIQATQQLMAAERALEAQRLQAQITATGRQQSLTRLAEIRRTEQGLMAQATAQQQALHAAQQQTLISAQALATAQERAGRAATATNAAYAASTAAANTAATAHTALAGAMRIGRAAMAPLGGPLGVATLAASAFFLFRDSSDEVNASLVDLDQPLEQTIESFREMTREAQQAALVEWGRKFEDQAARSRDALGEIRQEIAKLGGASIFGGRDEAQYENYRRLLTEINKVEEGSRSLADVLEEAQGYMDIPDEMFEELLLLARDYSNLNVSMDETESLMDAARAAMEDAAAAAENTGQAVNNGAPSATTLDAWAKYNDRLRESIAATRDGGSAMGAANRALDGMGDDVTNIMRGYSVFLSVQDEALKDQRKAQQEAAAESRRAAEEAERNAQRQAQAAQQSAEAQAKALAGLQQEMDPLLADHAEYIERLAVLDRALAEGTISEEAYGEAVRWNAEQYQRAATGAEDYEKQSKSLISTYYSHNQKAQQLREALAQINQMYRAGEIDGDQYARMVGGVRDEMQQLALDADPAAQEMARAWEEASNRIDETFADAFAGAFDSFDDFTDQLLDGFKRLLAELAYQATLKPIVVQFTQQMGGALGIPGVGGQGGGGFNLGSIGSLKNGWDTVSGLFGGGSAASGGLYANALTGSAAAGGLYAGASTGAAVGGLYGNALTGAATTASGGFMSAVGSAMPWIGAGLLVDNLLGLGITDGIVEGISSIFGGGKSDPRLNISTRVDAGQFSHESVRTGAFGAVGFSEGTKRSNDLFGSVEQEREWLASVAALDNMTAAAARTPEQLDAMTSAVQNMVLTSGDAQGAIDQLAGRTAAATRVIDAELTQTLLDAGASAEQIAQRFATARNAVDLITAASERLNLQYDANADGALRYADSLVQAYGSLDNIAAIQDAYYNAAFSDQERLQHQFDDVRSALSGLTDEAPRTVAELRALVEAKQLNGEASQQLAYDLMALAPALKQTNQAVRDAITQQYQDVLGRAPAAEGLNYWFDQVASGALTLEGALSSIANSTERLAMDNQAIWDNITSSLEDQYRTSLGRDANAEDLYYWMTQIESGAVSLDQALQLIASSTESVTLATASGVEALRKRAQLERQLLTLQGDTAELRRRELEELNPANRALQTRIWNLEYEKDAQAAANRAQQERIRNLEQEARAMMSAGGNIRQFVESLQNTAGAGLSPEAAYQNAEESFLAAISTIYTSDDSALVQDTINGITGIAQQYLSAAEAYGASGNIYQQAQALVEGSLDDLAGRLGSDELESIDPQLAAMVAELKSVAANTGLSGPLAKQVPLAQTFAEFFGGNGSQNYMYRQLGALAGIEAAIRDTAAKAVEESTPQGRTLSVSQAAAALRGSGNSQLASLFSSSKSTAQHAGNLEYNLGGLLNGENRGLVDTVTANTIARALDFDESRYFSLNQDVAAAVSRGEFASGLQHFVSHGLQEGRQFWEGGYTGPGGKYEPAGIVHRGEVVWSQDDISAWGGVGVVESLRRGPMELPMPDLPLPQFPALGQSDVTQVLQDMRREIAELRKQNAALLGESNSHLAAANTQRGAAATQQIAATKEGNKMLKKMQDDARLEAAKR